MNPAIQRLYADYLALTGENTAAANLALAHVMQESGSVRISSDQPLTAPEVAKFLRVRPDKVLAWIRSGRLRGYNVAECENGRPKYRVNRSDLEDFIRQRSTTQPAPKGRPKGRHRIPVIERPSL